MQLIILCMQLLSALRNTKRNQLNPLLAQVHCQKCHDAWNQLQLPQLQAPMPILSYNLGSIMTSFIPSLALPSFVFEQPAISILLPVALGTGVGYSTRRTFSHTSDWSGVSTN